MSEQTETPDKVEKTEIVQVEGDKGDSVEFSKVDDIDIEETLNESETRFPDSSIKIECEKHHIVAQFFSAKANKYKCFKCLIEEQELVYIDKRFKKEMEEFERIKQRTTEAISNSYSKLGQRELWREQIRRGLMDARQFFLDQID